MYSSIFSSRFRRDVKRCKRQQKNLDKFKTIHELLVTESPLPAKNRDHFLTGNWDNHRECHIEPDWLLIYRINKKEKIIEYVRMGSHADLFSN